MCQDHPDCSGFSWWHPLKLVGGSCLPAWPYRKQRFRYGFLFCSEHVFLKQPCKPVPNRFGAKPGGSGKLEQTPPKAFGQATLILQILDQLDGHQNNRVDFKHFVNCARQGIGFRRDPLCGYPLTKGASGSPLFTPVKGILFLKERHRWRKRWREMKTQGPSHSAQTGEQQTCGWVLRIAGKISTLGCNTGDRASGDASAARQMLFGVFVRVCCFFFLHGYPVGFRPCFVCLFLRVFFVFLFFFFLVGTLLGPTLAIVFFVFAFLGGEGRGSEFQKCTRRPYDKVVCFDRVQRHLILPALRLLSFESPA